MEGASIDVVGPFPRTRKGSQYIHTICDCLIKRIEAFALKDQESTTIMETFYLRTNLKVGLEPQM